MARFFLFLLSLLLLPGAVRAVSSDELVYGSSEVPVVQARARWESDASLRKLLTWLPDENHIPPDYAVVERVVVHDQGCGDPLACTENATQFPVQTIQNIFRFHAVTRGWGDIGYNYIIDRQGGIYEGRFGGNGVRGAHLYHDARCENFNIGTAGVLLLGDWRAGPMTDEQKKGLERLSAWLGVANGFDPSDTAKTSKVWADVKSGSSCDASGGGFTSTFTGAALLSHGDIEKGNSDLFDFSPMRPAAARLRNLFASYAWGSQSEPTVYSIQGGGLYLAADTKDASKIVRLAASQLDLFPFRLVRALADGTLIKSTVTPDVYVMEAGRRRSISAPILFALLGYRRDNIQAIADRELKAYPLGDPKAFPEGTLVQQQGKEEVFVSKSGYLRHVSSAALFTKLGFVWQKILRLLPDDFKEMPAAEPLKFQDGVLVKGGGSMVYVIESEGRRSINSASLFTALGFRWGDIVALEDYELERYALGEPVKWPDGALIRAAGSGKVYLVQHGFKRWVETAEAFLALGYQWQDILVISVDEMRNYAEGAVIAAKNDLAWTPPPPPTQGEGNEQGGRTIPPAPPSPPMVPPNASPPPPSSANVPTIRVGITKIVQGSTVRLSATTSASVKKNGVSVETVPQATEYAFPFSAADTYRFEPQDGGIVTVLSYEDRPSWNPSLNDNRFRGAIEVKAAQDASASLGTDASVWLINELSLEEYLKGVAETVNGDPPEYGKAFSIAARSYALYHITKGGKRAGEPFHLRKTSEDQLYKGYGFELRATDPVAAATATYGTVAVFNGSPIVAAYSSGAPGPTKSGCEVWGSIFCDAQFDYLDGGVPGPQGTVYQYQSCGGAVHCVGMDAAGARRMAALGRTYDDILKTYYPGVALEKRW